MLKLYYLNNREIPAKERNMKTWLKTLIAIMLMLTCVFTYAACDGTTQEPDNTPSGDTDPNPDNENTNNGVIQPDIPEKSYRIKFVYSYTAQTKNNNDRTQNVKESVTVHTVYVDYENNGWTDALKAEKDAINYNGYKFDCWYAQWDDSVKPQVPVGDPYTFDGEINSDIVLYAYRGDKVGDNIVWDIEYFYETADAVLSEDVPEGSAKVDFVYQTAKGNVKENIALAAKTVSKDADAAALAAFKTEVDKITYNGCSFTSWYTYDAEGNKVVYNFTTAPSGDLVLYGEIFDPTVLPEVPDEIPQGSFKVDFVYADEEATIGTLVVDGTIGWTEAQKAMKDALSYNGYPFAAWYTANSETAYTFSEALTADLVLYGQLSETELTPVVTEKDERGAILNLTGYGKMYDANMADEVDVPWYSHRKSITTVNLVPYVDEDGKSHGITYIGKNAFADCTKLTSVDWGDDLEEIGVSAFEGANAKAFKYLRLPSTVKTVGQYAFAKTSLQYIYFEEDTVTVKDNQGNVVKDEQGNDVVTKVGINTIDAYAFSSNKNIKYVVVPTTLAVVGENAFNPNGTVTSSYLSKVYYMGTDNSPITGVDATGAELGENAKKINISGGNDWFKSELLTTIYTYMSEEESNKTVDGKPVYDAEDLKTSGHWNGDKVNSYAVQYAFALKYQFKSVTVATDYVRVSPKKDANNDYIFDQDGNLELEGVIQQANLDFRYNLYHNGYRFYSYTDNDKYNTIDATITEDTAIECKRNNEGTNIYEGNLGGGITWTYTIDDLDKNSNTKDGVLTIKAAAANAEIHANETKNRTWDFATPADATSLWFGNSLNGAWVHKVIIEDGVERIGKFVFAGLVSITEVVIPESVTEIDPTAFDDCASLLSVYYMKDGVDIVDAKGEKSSLTAKNAVSFVKAEAGTDKDGAYWMQMGDKKVAWKLTTETVEENGTVKTTGRNLYVGGDVEMIDFAVASEAPWHAANDSITSLTVANNITKLGANMVLNYKNINDISLPEHLRVIPASALAGTGVVNNVAGYTDGMLIINRHLIKVNPALFRTVADANKYISTNFFATNANIFTIAGGAFARCETLTDLFISNTIQYINVDAFDDPSKIANIFVNLAADKTTGVPATWPGIVKDITFDNAKVYYAGEYSPVTVTLEGGQNVTVGYKGNEGVCHHIYGNWADNTAATCIANATQKRVCKFSCGLEGCEDVQDVANTMLEHTYGEWKYNNDATCSSYGTETHTCTTCEDAGAETAFVETRKRESGEYAGHAYGEWVFDDNATDCCYGTESRTCTTCLEGDVAKETRLITEGERELVGHTFTTYVYNNDATCEHAETPSYGTETATCDVCKIVTKSQDRKSGEGVEYADCVFDQEVVDEKYLKEAATTESAAVYWKSCKHCGTASTNEADVFTSGEPLTSEENQ